MAPLINTGRQKNVLKIRNLGCDKRSNTPLVPLLLGETAGRSYSPERVARWGKWIEERTNPPRQEKLVLFDTPGLCWYFSLRTAG